MQGFLARNVYVGRVAGIQVRLHLLFWLFFGAAALMVLHQPRARGWEVC